MDKKHLRSITRLLAMCVGLILLFSCAGNMETTDALTNSQQESLNDIQRNSISMLNYLTVLTQQINASKNSRLYLEEAYSELINNISPNAVDARTLEQLIGILDTLEDFRMAAVKRERLKYYHEQKNAQIIRSLVPNPINILGIIQAGSLPAIALSIASTAFDAATNYALMTADMNLELLEEGWVLDDEEAAVLHNSRKSAFNYMVSIVNEHGLPGELALNENNVNAFVSNKNNSNVVQRIQFLETNQETYQAFGDYWLVLAESYYNHGDYLKCLDAVASYESLNVKIFRKDYNLAKVLPLAIAAAGETRDPDEYISFAKDSCKIILDNIGMDDWMLRYFVAHTYINLFDKTKDTNYLKSAYALALDNVNWAVNEQKKQNAEYLAEVVEASFPKDAPKETKDEINQYNKFLKEERKKTTPPVYEPLLLNCDLLFMLAGELDIEESEKVKVDGILHGNGERIFLAPAIDAKYWFKIPAIPDDKRQIEVSFTGKEITIPADYASSDTHIKLTVKNPETDIPSVYEDWVLQRVDRKSKGNPDTFTAVYQSESAQKHKYATGSTVEIEVLPKNGVITETYVFKFTASENKSAWWEVVKVWEDNITFTRTQ